MSIVDLGIPLAVRSELAVRGVRTETSVRRGPGAGPSDDGHLVVDGVNAALPIDPGSPYVVRDGRILDLGAGAADLGVAVTPVRRPRFYDLATADGVAYQKIALLHGRDVLASTVVQTCVRYAESQRCRFCAIEESLYAGSTVAAKTPAQLAEVAAAAVELDGVRQVVLTTGTTTGPDRGAIHLARCVRAITAAVPGIPVQVQIEPPGDLDLIDELHRAGATAIGIHAEALDDEVRRAWMPGKGSVPMAEYEAAWDRAVAVFGRNHVSTYVLIGLGEDTDELVAACGRLVERGVYPFVVPLRVLPGTLAHRDGATAPDPAVVADVTRRVADRLRAAGMRGADQGAGCAACGACSALPAAGA